ncbi:MAG: DMT family transporter [Firmicutes bacterium]|nr:DMT family transporter [Bacillota bacterium]
MSQNKARLADLSLLGSTVIWGGTFPVIKLLVGQMTPHYLVGIRFLVGFLALTVFCLPRLRRLDGRILKIGTLLGLVLWGGYITQTMGLQYTSASKGGFITGLSVVFVPILSALWLKNPPRPSAVWGVVLATAGLAFLSLDLSTGFSVEIGDLLILGSAVLWALQVVIVARYAPQMDSLLLAWVQIGTVAVAGMIFAGVTESPPIEWGASLILGLLYLAVLATALSLAVQIWSQKYTSPTRVGIILAMEPVFATIFARIFLGEVLSAKAVAGCGLVLAGMLLAEVSPLERWQEGRSA